MPTETIPVRGGEVIVLYTSAGVAFTVEEASGDRIAIRLVPRAAADSTHRADLLAYGASEEVIQFADRLGILDHIATAVGVAHSCFPSAQQWAFFIHESPAQVEIHVTLQGSVDEVYRKHADCVERWVKLLPPEVLGKVALTEDFG
jgi:hypothetical protein